MRTITLGDLRTTKKVIRHMQREAKKSPAYNNTEGTVVLQMLDALIQYADDLGDEIRKEKK